MPGPHCQQPTACKAKGVGAHCRTCANLLLNRSPEKRAKSAVAMRRYYADPENYARQVESIRATTARIMEDPEARTNRQRAGREFGAANIHHTRTPEARAKAGRAISAAHLAHIPESARPLYRELRKTGMSAAERELIAVESDLQAARRDVRVAAEEMARRQRREKAQAY